MLAKQKKMTTIGIEPRSCGLVMPWPTIVGKVVFKFEFQFKIFSSLHMHMCIPC
jgi:hypothetical protein